MKPIFWFGLFLLAACGNPSFTGLPVTEDPDGETSETPADPTEIPLYENVRLFMDSTGITMTNAAVIGTELTNNNSRIYVDLTDFTQVRGQFVSSLTSATVYCRIEYSLNDGGAWATLVPNFVASTSANITSKSAFVTIPDAARTDVLLRALIGGDGVLDPIVRYVGVDLKGLVTVV